MFRAVVKTGWISRGTDATKQAAFYRYNVKRGSNELIINGISEEFKVLRR